MTHWQGLKSRPATRKDRERFFSSPLRRPVFVPLFARLIIVLVRICEKMAGLLFRIQQLLTGMLPVLLSPTVLTELIRDHYDDNYKNVAAHSPETCYKWALESWEEDVLARHKITSGTILVLGAGVGRESIALAQRGFTVVGLDINRESLGVASQQASPRETFHFPTSSGHPIPMGSHG